MATIDSKIEYWRNQLLDLGKRNRLINCPAPKQGGRVSRSSIAIKKPVANILWAQFADDNKPLVFPLPADDVDDMEHEDNESQFEISLCLTDKNYADSTFSNNSI